MLFRLNPFPELVNSILDSWPSSVWKSNTSTFIDPEIGGGQFVAEIEKRLRQNGHSDANIRKRVFGFSLKSFESDYVLNNHDLKGTYETVDSKKTLENILRKMKKFDNGVTNGPFQDADSNPLYYFFHNILTDIVKDAGNIGNVTPIAMATALQSGIIKGCHTVNQREIIRLNISTSIKKNYFPQVGIAGFCWYVLKNSPKKPNAKYSLITDDGESYAILDRLRPLTKNPLALSILKKCFDYDANPYKGTWTTIGNTAIVDPKGQYKVALAIKDDKKLETYNVRSNKRHKLVGKPKVFIAAFGNRAVPCYDHRIVCAKEKNLYTVPTASDKESINLVHLLDCKLQKFLTKVINARGPMIDFIRHFKGVSLNKKWSDKELFEHFNLDKDEKNYITSNY